MTREEFFPGFAKRKSYYEQEFPTANKNRLPWYDVEPQERAHKAWLKKVTDPATGEYYKGPEGELPQKSVARIVRFKRMDGKEFLYTMSYVTGYNMWHEPIQQSLEHPETYMKPFFTHETVKSETDEFAKRITTGVEEKKQYDLEWSPENFDKLLAQRAIDGYELVLVRENAGHNEQCLSEEWFRNKPFDWIFNREWQTAEDKEYAIKQHEALTGDRTPPPRKR